MMKIKTFLISCVMSCAASVGMAQQACPANDFYTFDWNNENYANGSLVYTSSIDRDNPGGGLFGFGATPDPVDLTFSFSGATNRLLANYPQVSTAITGGFGNNQDSLSYFIDLNNTAEQIVLTIDFSRPVLDLFFTLMDMDLAAAANGTGGYRDSIRIEGYDTSLGGSMILPDLTTPYNATPSGQIAPSLVYVGNPLPSNVAIANPSNGNSSAASNSNIGNVRANFDQAVDQVVITYYNDPAYFNSDNPAQQLLGLYDLSFCVPRIAILTYEKSVSLFSETGVGCDVIPGTPDPAAEAAAPGACLQYDIFITNTGTGAATGTNVTDIIDPSMIFAGATQSGFVTTDANFAFTTPAPMTDCGAVQCTLSLESAIVPAEQTGHIILRTILK